MFIPPDTRVSYMTYACVSQAWQNWGPCATSTAAVLSARKTESAPPSPSLTSWVMCELQMRARKHARVPRRRRSQRQQKRSYQARADTQVQNRMRRKSLTFNYVPAAWGVKPLSDTKLLWNPQKKIKIIIKKKYKALNNTWLQWVINNWNIFFLFNPVCLILMTDFRSLTIDSFKNWPVRELLFNAIDRTKVGRNVSVRILAQSLRTHHFRGDASRANLHKTALPPAKRVTSPMREKTFGC